MPLLKQRRLNLYFGEEAVKILILTVIAVGLLTIFAVGQSRQPTIDLPKLHEIKNVTLSPSYSCRSAGDFATGYAGTALFLSDFAKQRTGPDLLFNGACGSADYFEAATAGDDMSLIADLGANVSLSELSALRAFNLKGVHTFPAYSKFARVAKVEAGHTYAVLLNSMEKRGLFVFTVTKYVPNQRVSLRYAVKSYQVMPAGRIVAPGFEWEQRNTGE